MLHLRHHLHIILQVVHVVQRPAHAQELLQVGVVVHAPVFLQHADLLRDGVRLGEIVQTCFVSYAADRLQAGVQNRLTPEFADGDERAVHRLLAEHGGQRRARNFVVGLAE